MRSPFVTFFQIRCNFFFRGLSPIENGFHEEWRGLLKIVTKKNNSTSEETHFRRDQLLRLFFVKRYAIWSNDFFQKTRMLISGFNRYRYRGPSNSNHIFGRFLDQRNVQNHQKKVRQTYKKNVHVTSKNCPPPKHPKNFQKR